MSDAQTVLLARLNSQTAITNLLQSPICFGFTPNQKGFPHITLTTLGSELIDSASTYVSLRTTSIQVDCWASEYTTARNIANLVTDALHRWKDANTTPKVRDCRLVSDTDLNQPEERIYRVSLDFELFTQGY
jgi:hypothetical protein